MLVKECRRLRGGERALLALDGRKGATLSFTTSVLASIRRARDKGILVNAAAMIGRDMLGKFCVRAMIAGDGFRGLNQSPNDWTDFCLYSGEESYASIRAFLEPVLQEITALNTIKVVHDVAANQIYHVRIGKRSHNVQQGFSAFCLCPFPSLSNFDIENHVLLTSAVAAMLTHTSPGAAYHNAAHEDFQCPA
eukprot:6058124-Pleurochrysis_carterae.AAC.1